MTREQAKQNLKNFGVAEPTEEQITNYLNQVNAETLRERERADRYKKDSENNAELQKQLDELNSKNLSDIEKANKATETANNRVAELEKQIVKMQTRASLADKCKITGDEAEKFFKEDGSVDFDLLGQIIATREANAASQKEKDILSKTKNPGNHTPGEDGRSEAEKYVADHSAGTNNFDSSIKGYF